MSSGISVADERHIVAVAQSVAVSRQHSVIKNLCVMVGGPQGGVTPEPCA
jgi:hypothetical protein